MIEMELTKLILRETSDHQYIFLKEKGGERSLPIVIGYFEAAEINRQVREMATPRPMTHELISKILQSLEAKLERIVVTELKNNTFFARLVLRKGDKVFEIDSRPSDAIALATREKTPIFVDEQVIENLGQGM